MEIVETSRSDIEIVSLILVSSMKGLMLTGGKGGKPDGTPHHSEILAFEDSRKTEIVKWLEEYDFISWDGTWLVKSINISGVARDIFPTNFKGSRGIWIL